MKIAREKRTQSAVHQATCKDFIIICLTFTFCKTTRETSGSSILLTIFYLQWHEICARYCVLCCTDSGKKHSITHCEGTATISLLCQFSCLNSDGTTIR